MKLKQKTSQKQQQEQQSIGQTIDSAWHLDTEIKEKTKILKDKKSNILEHAREVGGHEISGAEAAVKFSDETKTYINPQKLFDLMVDLGMENEFFDVVSVKVGDAKAKVGEIHLDTIADTETKTFAKMSFKKREE